MFIIFILYLLMACLNAYLCTICVLWQRPEKVIRSLELVYRPSLVVMCVLGIESRCSGRTVFSRAVSESVLQPPELGILKAAYTFEVIYIPDFHTFPSTMIFHKNKLYA